MNNASFRLTLIALMSLNATAARSVTIDWVTVGDPGNAPDDLGPGTIVGDITRFIRFGAVPYTYRVGKFEVTNAQFAEFLNAVAADDDPYELYNGLMHPDLGELGGIVDQCDARGCAYVAVLGRENKPVGHVSFWDAIRFANWLHNGQPTGPQGPETTEDGAYTITDDGILNNTIRRNREATVFLPSEDEWYKAAYYKGGGTNAGYWEFPTATDEPPIAEWPPGGPNSANYNFFGQFHDFTDGEDNYQEAREKRLR